MNISVVVKSNRLPGLPGKMRTGFRALVQDTGEEVRDGAKERSRVDTGDMRDRWQFAMTGDTEGEVVNDSDHVLPNEFGTIHMSPQPMGVPAADAARPGFVSGAQKVIAGL